MCVNDVVPEYNELQENTGIRLRFRRCAPDNVLQVTESGEVPIGSAFSEFGVCKW